jgi:hypothetical protein
LADFVESTGHLCYLEAGDWYDSQPIGSIIKTISVSKSRLGAKPSVNSPLESSISSLSLSRSKKRRLDWHKSINCRNSRFPTQCFH